MSRLKGTPNKPKDIPELSLSEEERVELIANLILDIINDEQIHITEEALCQTK